MPTDSERKSKATLDRRLTADEQAAFFGFVEKHDLGVAAAHLKATHGIELSEQAISTWAERQRRMAADIPFQVRLRDIREASLRATAIASELTDPDELHDANVGLLATALFDARMEGDDDATKAAAKTLSMVLESVAKSKAAKASVIAAETSRDKFQWNAAEAALNAAEDLYKINHASDTSKHEKVQRAIVRLFGTKPSGFFSTEDLLAKVEGDNSSDSHTGNQTLAKVIDKGVSHV